MAQQPHGQLQSFGSSNATPTTGDRLSFQGAGALSGNPRNTAPALIIQGLDDTDYSTGQLFGAALTALSPRPWKDSQLTYQYFLACPPGTADGAVWLDMQARIDALWAWYFGSYAYSNADGSVTYSTASGMAGDLIAKDAGGAARTCRAEWDEWTAQFVPGAPSHYLMTLVFTQVSDWV